MAFSNEYTSIEFLAEFDPGVAARNFGRGENNSQLQYDLTLVNQPISIIEAKQNKTKIREKENTTMKSF